MSRGGQNRLPDAVKAQRGTQQKCRTNPNAPKLDATKVPPPPKGLSKEQREAWLELAPQVDATRAYTVAHYTAFRLLVQTVAEARHPDPRDPATARVRLAQVAAGLLQRFGLDPASSGRVSAPPEQGDSAEEFLFSGAPELKVVNGGGNAGGR